MIWSRKLRVIGISGLLSCALLAVPATAMATDESWLEGPGYWRLALSPYTRHYDPKPEHESVWAVAVERHYDSRWLLGASYFSNSFGQSSAYVYGGRTYSGLFDVAELFVQWSVGLLYGYKGDYADKVPLNDFGVSPGAVLSLGWRFNPELSTQLNVVGAGLMIQFSYDFQ